MARGRDEPMAIGSIFLGTLAVLLLVATFFGNQSDAVKGGLLFAGVLLAVTAVFAPRIEGILRFWNAEIPIKAATRRAERQIQQGQVIEAEKLDDIFATIEGSRSGDDEEESNHFRLPSSLETGDEEKDDPEQLTVVNSGPIEQQKRMVYLVDEAVAAMSVLTPSEQAQLRAEVEFMSGPLFQPDSDPVINRRGDHLRAYRVHEVRGSDVRLWYREGDDNPWKLYVMVVEKKGELA